MALTKGCFNVKAVKTPQETGGVFDKIGENAIFRVVFDGGLKREDKIERLALIFRNAVSPARVDSCIDDLKLMHSFLQKERAEVSQNAFRSSLTARATEKNRLDNTLSETTQGIHAAYSILHSAIEAAANPQIGSAAVAFDIAATFEDFDRMYGSVPAAPAAKGATVRRTAQVRKFG
jgi:hypothetical protein